MKVRKIISTFALILVLSSAGGAVCARPPEGSQPPPMSHMGGHPSFCADEQSLYVMAGGSIMQYRLTDMALLKTVDAPKPPSPPSVPPEGGDGGKFPPPPFMMGPHGLWANGGYLYVMAGQVIYRYSTTDLTLKNTVELPKPKYPDPGNQP